MKPLAGIQALVVPLGLSGVWFSCRDGRPSAAGEIRTESTLVYDPKCIEGDWEKDRPGLLLGYTSCLTLAILRELSAAGEAKSGPNLISASQRGLSVMRALHSTGLPRRPARRQHRTAIRRDEGVS